MAGNESHYSKKYIWTVIVTVFLLCTLFLAGFHYTLETGIYPGGYTYDYQKENEMLIVNQAFSEETIRIDTTNERSNPLAVMVAINFLQENWANSLALLFSFLSIGIFLRLFKKRNRLKNFHILCWVYLVLFAVAFTYQIFSYNIVLEEVKTRIESIQE